jgi:deoxyhypusine synthase
MNVEAKLASDAVLQGSEKMPEGSEIVKGYDWSQGVNYEELLKSFRNCGFQATNFGRAVDEINRMLEARDVPLEDDETDEYEEDEFIKRRNSCTIFFGFTSNLVSSGLRETIRYLVQNKLVDAVVASAGGFNSIFSPFLLLNCFHFQEVSKKTSSNALHQPSLDHSISLAAHFETKARIASEISLCPTTTTVSLKIG